MSKQQQKKCHDNNVHFYLKNKYINEIWPLLS